MRRNFLSRTYPVVVTALFAISIDGFAQSTAPRMLGMAAPFQLADLPAQSPMRQQLQALPAPQRTRAMAWLHSFSFPQDDLASLRIDNNGGVYYSDAIKPRPGSTPLAALTATAAPLGSTADAFKLHSKPGASNKVFLDFDGHTITRTAWNESVGAYYASGFDLDNNPSNFNNDERGKIAEIWHRIAEDYAPFDIDVTTEQPQNFGPHVGHVLFTRDKDRNGVNMPAMGSAGVAYVNVWGIDSYRTYSPALVYYNVLNSGYPPYLAEVGSHEFGHNLGLSHDGTLDGSRNYFCINDNEYFCGMGSGNISWAPIMGAGYYANVTQWSKGEYPYANNNQDDIGIIRQKLNYRPDDIRNVTAQASQLLVERDGSIVVSNPQNDPLNNDAFNKGIIGGWDDIDMFCFDAEAGPLNITVNPAWDAYYRSNQRGANLDVKASLYNANGNLVMAGNPSDETNASISATVLTGKYYLAVTGIGNPVTPYSDYGSIGQYFISGRVTVSGSADANPPKPNPMTWVSKPYAQDSTSISMTATVAEDEVSQVQYLFRCLSGGPGCVDSGWQISRRHIVRNLAPGKSYTFSVQARDQAGNITAPSVSATATTESNQIPVVKNDSVNGEIRLISLIDESTVQIAVNGGATLPVLENDSDPDGDSLTIVAVGNAKYGDLSHNGKTITYTPKNKGLFNFDAASEELSNFFAGDSFSYTVSDGHGGKASATATVIYSTSR